MRRNKILLDIEDGAKKASKSAPSSFFAAKIDKLVQNVFTTTAPPAVLSGCLTGSVAEAASRSFLFVSNFPFVRS
jgi:hypothetical protein